jgi:predicted DCC family thiol-disulfide oxidoreductase YuxK
MEEKTVNIATVIEESQAHPVILFDGVCNLCNGFVQFLIKRDPQGQFRFVALQSETGQALLQAVGLQMDQLDTVVLVENGKAYTHSDVGLRVARRMAGLWPLLYSLSIFPPFLRTPVYNWIARNRYRWFGKQEACMMPTPDLKARFL